MFPKLISAVRAQFVLATNLLLFGCEEQWKRLESISGHFTSNSKPLHFRYEVYVCVGLTRMPPSLFLSQHPESCHNNKPDHRAGLHPWWHLYHTHTHTRTHTPTPTHTLLVLLYFSCVCKGRQSSSRISQSEHSTLCFISASLHHFLIFCWDDKDNKRHS